MKVSPRTSSCAAALLVWMLFSALTILIILGTRDRARLIRDNENERILNMLFAGLRDYDDFGSAIESLPLLTERIIGFALYGSDRSLIYRWGTVPPVLDGDMLKGAAARNGRYTIPDKRGHSVKFILHFEKMPMPPRNGGQGRYTRRESWFSTPLARGDYFYINISHSAYWRTRTFTAILFPLAEIALLALVWYIRGLYLRNREYRERIEAQKNLVVLGTAAGTLAHEIKTPLLSIRLQTGILEKLLPHTGTPNTGREELEIINEEVDRLSALIYRVNDYLREAEGNRIPINSYDLIRDISRRLRGRNIIRDDAIRDGIIFMDADRARSVFENIIRNALESGGREDAVEVSITRSGGKVIIGVLDRGTGIKETDLKRVFDPFFTSKSTGTGIGLSISKRFIEAVKGSIGLENREDGGTLVKIILAEYGTAYS
ncbi:MAG: HAMP domain-containing histidine kinase [Spirochaetaceae bacterium]|jgi:two-component system sensor histidine kinase HydH|nr:HAMP domain-containing histidine kinase [Spirochaetaceae bacterium]